VPSRAAGRGRPDERHSRGHGAADRRRTPPEAEDGFAPALPARASRSAGRYRRAVVLAAVTAQTNGREGMAGTPGGGGPVSHRLAARKGQRVVWLVAGRPVIDESEAGQRRCVR